jgi:hypothetical protein
MARIKSGGERASKVTSMQRHLEAWRNSGLSQRAYLDTAWVDLLRKIDIQLRLKKAVSLLFKTNQHVNHQKMIHQKAET